MHTTAASQATPPPSADFCALSARPDPHQLHLLPDRPHPRRPAPRAAPTHPRHWPTATMPPSPTMPGTGGASLLPGNADEAHLAARVAAADAYAMDCLRLAHDCRAAPMLFPMHRPGRLHDREAHGARAQLMRIQAERRKREADNATRDQAAWIEHCAIGLMMQAQPGAAPVVMPDPPPPPPRPRTGAGRRTPHRPGRRGRPVRDHVSAACRAHPCPGRPAAAARFRRASAELVRAIIAGDSPGLRALDAGAVACGTTDAAHSVFRA